ncbi:hypothetical protein [Thermococcus barophilus]|uniref:Uncharacterized protein n=1 Tax=Thermococcus barophilus (strain DSM 11836 / MP) TaxID=391623 RepID=F0LMS9_THEBM|nr:hypothetical protein [Thermococcus barophilus]ADT84058.1 hypothetical protein TERMP_01082 [Thermococcus barophilus MP]
MKTILIKPKGGKIISAIFVVFFILFLLPVVFVYTHTSGGKTFLLLFMAFAALLFVAGVYFQHAILKQAKKAESLFSIVSISESGISFPEELEFEYGILNMKAWWSSSGKSRSYHVSREFISAGTARASNIPFINAEFKMLITADGSGFVSAPAVKILSEPYKDVVFLFLTEKGKVDANGTLVLSTDNDSAQIIVKGVEENIAGRVYSTLNKARKVKIAISAPESTYEIPIAEGDNFEFSYRMLPEEKILIAGGYSVVDPNRIRKYLNKREVAMGHGEFILTGTLDLPLRRDVSESITFNVSLEERDEWGF